MSEPALGRRAVHVVTSDAFAGIERHTLNLIRAQQHEGWRSDLACPPTAERLRREATRTGARTLPDGGGHPGTWWMQLVRTLIADPPDVLHVHDGRGAALGRVAALRSNVVFIRTQHFVHTATMSRSGPGRHASLMAHRFVNARLDGYVAVSSSVMEAAHARGETGEVKTEVIPPAIALPEAHRLTAARTAREASPYLSIGFTGRLEEERHLDVLLRAIPIVLRTAPDCRFVLAGNGNAGPELHRLSAELDIDDAITWTGWVDDTYTVLEHVHAYVNTWPREAFGMAMAEAMALELPVIAANAGANAEMVEDGVSGLLFDRDDPEALARAIVTLAGDRPTTERMGLAAREHAIRSFGATSSARANIALYESLLQRT